MVGVTKIQRGNAGYWLAAVAEGGEDYYTKPGEAPGEWVGALADELGLLGQVDGAGYGAILEGRDPRTGAQFLERPPTRYRERPDGSKKRLDPVLGFDVRFSCPKSVSLLYALGDEATRERVIAVVNEAVGQGIVHLEREACFVRRGEGGQRIERGSGFAGMAFRHRMSRAGDPALHVHVVISNLTRAASDGKWLSLASPRGRSPLWTHGKSAGVVFQAALRAGLLREFGLDFEVVRNGYADLRGIPREAIDALSTRSAEIADWLSAHGADGVSAAQVAAYRTRERKDYGVDEDRRREEWIATAAPYGVSPESVGELAAVGVPRPPRQVTDADLDRALKQLEETSSHFDRRALLWALCDQLPQGASEAELSAAVDRVLHSERIVCLHEAENPLDRPAYTTPRIAALEQRFIGAAIEGTGAGAGKAPEETIAAVLDQHSHLGEDQREMVIRLTGGGERVIAVSARPGTGKTTALGAAREIWESSGHPVIGCATAKTASGELRDAGIRRSDSIAKLLMRAEELRIQGIMPLRPGTVIVVDEASTTSTPHLEALRLLAAECGGKLVVVGDPHQIAAIGPGGTFAHLTRVVEPVELTEIRRQRRAEDRQIVRLVHEGRGSQALDLLRAEDRVIVGDDLTVTLDAMLGDWHRDYASGADAVMIARRNRDVDYLNDSARELRRSEGALGTDKVLVGERAFAPGDRVQTRINGQGVANRERWDVIAVNTSARTVSLRRVGGDRRTVTLGPRYLDRRRQDGGPALEYAYALTKFGAQGKTVDRAYPLLDGASSLEQELVAISRGREVANVYAVASSELTDADLGPGRRELSDPLHDIRTAIEREGADYAGAEVSTRETVNALAPRQLADRRDELIAAGRAADPVLVRHDDLDRQIARDGEWLDRLSREREAIEAMPAPPVEELERVTSGEARAAERLRRAEVERAALPERAPGAPLPRPIDPSQRLEAVLIDKRIDTLVRRDIESARIEPSALIHGTLGTYPHADPDRAAAWHEGAHALLTYRYRNAIRDAANPLGPRPRDASARAEQSRVRLRLKEAQRRLGRPVERGIERGRSIERSIRR